MRDDGGAPTSGQNVQSLRPEETPDGGRLPGGKLRQDDARPRPSERLRQDDSSHLLDEKAPPPGVAASAGKADGAGKSNRPSKLLQENEGHLSSGDTGDSGIADGAAGNTGGNAPKDKKSYRSERRYDKAERRVEHTGAKLDRAKGKLAKQKPPKKPGLVGSIGKAAQFETWRYAHGKINQVEQENVGVEAAHKTELAGEGLVRGGTRFVKGRLRTRPARQVRKWDKKHLHARANHEFHRLVREHPEVKQNAVSRAWQKQKLKWKFQKQARETARQGARATQTIADAGRRLVSAVILSIKRHPIVILILGLVFALLLMLQSCMGAALSLANGLAGAVGGSSYTAEDADINSAELAYTQWETDLLLEAENAEQSHPGYDEYRYSIDQVGHDPHLLLSFLTAKYDDFTFADVEPILRDIFEQQYSLTFTEIVEERGNEEDGYYDYYILVVELTARPFAEVIEPLLDTQEAKDRYALYNDTKGNRAYVGSPFPFHWLPYVTSHFGYRTHPITGARDFHRGIDIAVPEGTEILAGGEGVVVEATTHSLYGLTVKIDYGSNGSSAGSVQARYSHCSALLVSAGDAVEAGQVIALVGSTGESTGPHLDLEVLKDGELLNPLYFAVIPRN